MTAVAYIEKVYTIEEYFELEKHSDIRHEFVNGKLYAMPGESIIANRIADNCGFQLRLQLNKKGYDTIRHDVRTLVKFKRIYRYPDVALAKRSEMAQTHAISKPELLIEVSSDNSKNTDHDAKVKEYTNLESLKYYIIVAQDETLVEVYSRDEKGWRFNVYTDLNQIINLQYFEASLNLSDIYENVILANAQSDV